MKRTFLLPSAAYIQPNMQTEFGRIPPCFLPLRTGVLLDQQMALFADPDVQKILSLPSDYVLETWQQRRIADYGLEVVRPPAGISLGASISFALNAAAEPASELTILHGDTLITGTDPMLSDRISLHYPDSAGYWALFSEADEALEENFIEDGENRTLSGRFDFSNGRAFLRALALEGHDFVKAIARYDKEIPLARDESGRWYDFGRLETYFLSRKAFTSERHFNDLSFLEFSVNKRSKQVEKMEAERSWFSSLPAPLQIYTPTLLATFDGDVEAGYEIEYLPICNLSELFVFAALPLKQWRRIARSSAKFLASCRTFEGPPISANSLYQEKTWERIGIYCDKQGLSLDTAFFLNGEEVGSLRTLIEGAIAEIDFNPISTVMHGDFCFSNILFDSRLGIVRAIDPRGGINISDPSIFGDPNYDVGKLHHSFLGGYDLIIAGLFELERHSLYNIDFSLLFSDRQKRVADIFEEELENEQLPTGRQPLATMVLLFLSMLPLHADRPDRQVAFLANALRLSQELKRATSD